MNALLGQVVQGGGWRTWSLVDILIGVVIVCAVIALVYIALQQFGITIPDWFKKVLMIIVVAIVIIVAIRIVVSL